MIYQQMFVSVYVKWFAVKSKNLEKKVVLFIHEKLQLHFYIKRLFFLLRLTSLFGIFDALCS